MDNVLADAVSTNKLEVYSNLYHRQTHTHSSTPVEGLVVQAIDQGRLDQLCKEYVKASIATSTNATG